MLLVIPASTSGPFISLRTVTGHVLLDEGDGGLTRSPVGSHAPMIPGYDGGATEYEGTYMFLDNDGQPVSTDGGAVSLVTRAARVAFGFARRSRQ